ncbi:MAG: Pvc16 family protein, partial [Chloroflexota bacterium]
IGNGNGQDHLARMKKSPHRIDCFYMLTTWAAEPEDEHRLLTRVLMTLFRHPVLPEHILVGTMQHPLVPIQTHVARHDKLTNPAEVWSAMDNEMRPSICYSATLALDPWTVIEGPIVQTLTLRSGRASRLPVYEEFDEDGFSTELTYIGGTIRSKNDGGQPLSGLQVAIKGRGWFDQTDEDGRFTLGGMPAGDYTLVVWPDKGKPKEKKISVPAKAGDYDLEL